MSDAKQQTKDSTETLIEDVGKQLSEDAPDAVVHVVIPEVELQTPLISISRDARL